MNKVIPNHFTQEPPLQVNPRLVKNNFDLLRLLFAATVCLVHAYQLSDFQELAWITRLLSSAVAVRAFFVVSGFLIFMSFERSSSLTAYASKRIRRIYPAYFAIVMICALGLALVTSNMDGYFSPAWLRYIAANLTFLNFLQPTLPGVFEFNKLTAVNGALWTLKIEVMFYLSVPIFAYLFRKFTPLPILAIIYFSSIAYAELLTTLAARTGADIYSELARQLPGQLCYFMAGAFFYYFLPLFERRIGYFLPLAAVITAINTVYPLPYLEPFALATLVIFFGLFLYVGNFGKYGDFSYGVYIVHFPIIQLLLATGLFQEKHWSFFAVVILLTTASSIAMWHLIEKRFLFRSNHYLATTS